MRGIGDIDVSFGGVTVTPAGQAKTAMPGVSSVPPKFGLPASRRHV